MYSNSQIVCEKIVFTAYRCVIIRKIPSAYITVIIMCHFEEIVIILSIHKLQIITDSLVSDVNTSKLITLRSVPAVYQIHNKIEINWYMKCTYMEKTYRHILYRLFHIICISILCRSFLCTIKRTMLNILQEDRSIGNR